MRLSTLAAMLASGLCVLSFAQPQPGTSASAARSPRVSIVYPGDGAKLPYLLKSFVFGAAPAGSSVTVNGERALVAGSGGWIAFVPFAPGRFALRIVAREGGRRFQTDRIVEVASPPSTIPAAPARIDARVAPEPTADTTLEPGDTVHLFVKASTGAHVTASIPGVASRVRLVETAVSALNPSDKERVLGDAVAGGASVGGLYVGDMHLTQQATGAQPVTYTVVANDGSTTTAVSKGLVTLGAPDSRRVGVITLPDHRKDIDARPYGIVESEPNGGWLFYPPAGTPFEITGGAGDYYRVALGSNQSAWIAKDSLALAPEGTPAPRAQVEEVVIRDGAAASTVIIHLTARVPYRIDELVEGPSLRVRMYGALAATDFIRYGSDRSGVRAVRWDELSGAVATVDIALRQRTLWGYHAGWSGDNLELNIKKPPRFALAPSAALRGLLVVVDAGHSPDIGAIGPLGTQERDVNLAISKRVAAHVERFGGRAILTRYSNVPVGLYDRPGLAARLGADILISVHNNALPDGANPFTHHGYSVYYYQPQSLELARAVHNSYARHTSLADYGLYYDNLALARPTEEPAILTESAFIMWPPEEMLLRDAAFVDTLGATLADGLERWAESMRAKETTKR